MNNKDKRGQNYSHLIEYNKKFGPWNKGKKGLQIPWNKGLTKKIDKRIREYSKKLSKHKIGISLSQEHRKKIRDALKGRTAPNKGIPASEKTKRKLKKLFLGKNNPFYGKLHTQETKEKISQSRKGKATGENNHNCVGHILLPQKEEMIRRYKEGESSNNIGEIFGVSGNTILKYLSKWSINARFGAYGFKGLLTSRDGHKVRSYPELQIDNFLSENGVDHEVEKVFSTKNKNFKCDFYIPDIDTYIEYWGIYHDKRYTKRKVKKIRIYKKNKLNLISISWNENPIDKLKFLIPICAKKQRSLFDFKT